MKKMGTTLLPENSWRTNFACNLGFVANLSTKVDHTDNHEGN